MSRWTDEFKNFCENKTDGWAQLETLISELKNVSGDDPFASSLMRLSKVFLQMDGIIKSLDGDLFPSQSYDTLKKNTVSLINTLNQFKTNRTEQNINGANVLIDNILLCLMPYEKISKRSITANMQNVKKYNDQVTTILDDAISKSGDLEVKMNTLIKEINEKNIKITEFFNQLFTDNDERQSIKQKIDNLLVYITTQKNNINGFHDLIFRDVDNKKSLKSELEEFKSKFNNIIEELDNKISEEEDVIENNNEYIENTKLKLNSEIKNIIDDSKETVSKLTDFYDKIFGVPQEDGSLSGGLEQEIEINKKKLIDLRTTQESEFSEALKKRKSEYENLKTNIEKLLPGATSAGLASAFSTAKEAYKDKIRLFTRVFYVSVLFLLGFGCLWLWNIIGVNSEQSQSILATATTGQLINSLIVKLPIIISLIWLATFSAKRRNEYTRLQEEYEHKWALTSSYLGFKQQIDEMQTDDDTLTKLLLKTAIETIGFNPSVTLSSKHDEKAPIVGNIIDFLKKKDKENR